MTNPHVRNPAAALATSAELTTRGTQLTSDLEALLGRIEAIGDPFGNDEVGQTLRANLNTDAVRQVLRTIGTGVTGFGSIATTGITTIVTNDERAGDAIGDIRI